MSVQSPLGRVLGSGSAKEGTEHWWGQKLTAVAKRIGMQLQGVKHSFSRDSYWDVLPNLGWHVKDEGNGCAMC